MKNANEYTIKDLVEAITRLNQDVMANRATLVLLQNKVKKLEQDLEEVSERGSDTMDDTCWMGLAIERKQALDSIKKIVDGLISDLHNLDEDGEGILFSDFTGKLNKILSLSDEDSRW